MAKKRTQYTSRARSSNKSAYGAPAEEREVVVTVDKRLLFGAALMVVFGLAVGISALSAARGRAAGGQVAAIPPVASAPQTAAGAVDPMAALAGMSEAEMRAEAREAGLPDSASIVQPEQYSQQVVSTVVPPASGAADGGDSITDVFDEMLDDPNTNSIDIDAVADERIRGIAAGWDHEVLAGIADPNVVNDAYKVFRVEDISTPLSGPRLGIQGLNTMLTYDFGKIQMNDMARTDLVMQNVGDEPLIISRVYSGCGCTAPRIGDVQIDEAGWLPEPMSLAPGETVDFTVEFDPQLAKEAKAQAKFIQIFSNDDSKEMFDPVDPNSHETRFRIVVQPTYETLAPASSEESTDSP